MFYPGSAAKGVHTRAVKGEMTAREALDALVAGTGLVVVRDEKSGAVSLQRHDDRNGRPRVAAAATGPPVEPPAVPTVTAPGPPRVRPATTEFLAEAIVLSPFEVVSDNKGYYAANPMSGTRLNSKLEDLGGSISVVTREQIEDFGLLDLNDIFNYEAGTEGGGNYTDFLFNRNFEPVSNTELSPPTTNRIRGLGAANTAWGNFETSGRVPIDPLNVDAVEISRGPNASLFGIGSPAGMVNAVPSTAHFWRNESQLSFRRDSFGGHRSTIDLNRVLKRDLLAVRGSAAWQHDGFDLKPSGLDTVRLNGMARYRPFSRTTFTASYSTYRMEGNRPNVTMPRETISGWIAAGRPTWEQRHYRPPWSAAAARDRDRLRRVALDLGQGAPERRRIRELPLPVLFRQGHGCVAAQRPQPDRAWPAPADCSRSRWTTECVPDRFAAPVHSDVTKSF